MFCSCFKGYATPLYLSNPYYMFMKCSLRIGQFGEVYMYVYVDEMHTIAPARRYFSRHRVYLIYINQRRYV